MSIVFGTVATSDLIDFGSGSTLDNLADLTYLAWVYRTSNSNNQHVITKDNTSASPRGPRMLFETSGANPELRMSVGGSSATAIVLAANGTSRIRRWECIAGTFRSSDRTCQVAIGTETAPMYRPTYSLETVGSGTFDDSAYNLYVGNHQRSPAAPFFGGIAWAGVYDRVLTLAEMERWRLDTMARRVPRIPGARLLSRLGGAGRQIDLSGNNNHGTRTGSLLSGDEPTSRERTLILFSSVVSDVSVALTGHSATAAAGALSVAHNNAISGSSATGSAGALAPGASMALTGLSGTADVGELAPSVTAPLGGAEVSAEAGSVAPGHGKALAGEGLTTSAGTLTLGIAVSLDGFGLAAVAGDVSVAGDKTVALTGQSAAVGQGSLSAAILAASTAPVGDGNGRPARRRQDQLEETREAQQREEEELVVVLSAIVASGALWTI